MPLKSLPFSNKLELNGEKTTFDDQLIPQLLSFLVYLHQVQNRFFFTFSREKVTEDF